jgi:threonine dehydrogenase-like Zn-dependent dehydrogenase
VADSMKAAVITGVKKIEVLDVPMPKIGPRDVLLKIKSTGLCTWEQRIYTGQTKADFPFLGGHEVAGEIADVGDLVTNVKVGDRVTMGSSACGTCRPCLRGQDRLKADNTVRAALQNTKFIEVMAYSLLEMRVGKRLLSQSHYLAQYTPHAYLMPSLEIPRLFLVPELWV